MHGLKCLQLWIFRWKILMNFDFKIMSCKVSACCSWLDFCLFVCFCVVLFVGFFDHMACIPPREGVWLSSKMKMISSYNSEPSGSWDYFSRLIHSRSCGIIASDIISPKPIANAHVWFINFFNVLQLHWSVSKSLGVSNHSSRSCLQKQLHSEQSGGVTELHQ